MEQQSTYGRVYVIEHLASGRAYVGQTTRAPEVRWAQHYMGRRGGCTHIHAALRKYGREAFRFEVVEACSSKEQLDRAERDWIALMDAVGPTGFNLTYGGEGGIPSNETRQKLSAARRRRVIGPETRAKISAAALGRAHSPERRAAIAAGKAGKPLSPQHRAAISATLTGRVESEETRRKKASAHAGMPLSAEHRQAIAQGQSGRPKSPEHRANILIAQRARRERERARKGAGGGAGE